MLAEASPLNLSTDYSSKFLSFPGRKRFSLISLFIIYFISFFIFIFWHIYQANFFSWQLLVQTYALFFVSGSLFLIPQNTVGRSQLFFVAQAVCIALLAISFYSTQSLFLVAAIALVFLSGFLHGNTFCFALSLWLAGLMNFAIIISGFAIDKVMLTPLIIYNGSLMISAVASSFLSGELRLLASDIGQTRENLRQLQNVNEKMIEKMASGVLVVHRSGQILKGNPEAQKIFEVSDFEDLNVEDLSLELWSQLKAYKKAELFEIEQETTEGYLMSLEAYVMPMDDTAETWIIFLQNRTQIKNMEERLRQSEKLAAVGQLAAGIAHEIRNPLASISGSIQLLAGSLITESAEDKKLLAIVIKEIDRLNDLITEFMEYVRPEAQINEKVNLSQLTQSLVEQLKRHPAAEGVELDVVLPESAALLANSSKLKQAFLNIFINACQAMQGMSTKKLSIHLQDEAEHWVYLIRDSGKGIPKDQIKKIFQPFHTTKPRGTGLGLAITYKIFEAHGASVDVQSKVGEGTHFEIRFEKNS